MISVVPPEMVDAVWGHVEHIIENGLRHGAGDTTSSAQLKQAVIDGESIMWAIHDETITAVVIWEVIQYPTRKVLFVDIVAGKDFKSWSGDVLDLLQETAQLVGAEYIEAACRKGMTKLLRDMGWKEKATIMRIDNGQ